MNCEICGKPAITVMRDYYEEINYTDGTISRYPDKTIHHYCEEHQRDSVCLFVDDPMLRGKI